MLMNIILLYLAIGVSLLAATTLGVMITQNFPEGLREQTIRNGATKTALKIALNLIFLWPFVLFT